jgi:hypothetical protein
LKPTNGQASSDEANAEQTAVDLSDTSTSLRLVHGSSEEAPAKPAMRTTSIAMVVPATALFGLH